MTRNIFIFLATFAVGAFIALVARAAMYKPHAGHEGHPESGGDYAAMVSNPLAPAAKAEAGAAAKPVPMTTKAPAPDTHSNHGTVTTPAAAKAVNTICAICGMAVDPKIPTVEYQGKTIGFGCKMCPPKFKADPDRYGPIYLKNETVKQ